jgi:hypothetical protein
MWMSARIALPLEFSLPQAYTTGFKELAVKRVKDGESIAVVVKD